MSVQVVSDRALLQRINRKLGKDHERVLKCRQNSRAYRDLGDYYRLDTYRNVVTDTHVGLEQLAEQLGVA